MLTKSELIDILGAESIRCVYDMACRRRRSRLASKVEWGIEIKFLRRRGVGRQKQNLNVRIATQHIMFDDCPCVGSACVYVVERCRFSRLHTFAPHTQIGVARPV